MSQSSGSSSLVFVAGLLAGLLGGVLIAKSNIMSALAGGHILVARSISEPLPLTGRDSAAFNSPATTGIVFKGVKVYNYSEHELLFRDYVADSQIDASANSNGSSSKRSSCRHWSVLTTIFEPTPAAHRQAQLLGWCFVIVGDKSSTVDSYDLSGGDDNSSNSSASSGSISDRVVFLNVEKQLQLAENYPFVHRLPWKSFSRKNIGYLYAISQNADSIWDFDDDNLLISADRRFSIPGVGYFDYARGQSDVSNKSGSSSSSASATKIIPVMEATGVEYLALNPYPLMGATTSPCWPRGYPLDHIKDNVSSSIVLTKRSLNVSNIGIIQALANHDPDVDAIYRLTQPLPFYFVSAKARTGELPLVIPTNKFTPYNAQATLHLYPSLWSMLLPITVHGRVADIWRSYMYQRLAREVGLRLVFTAAMVTQERNSHSYLADFDSEDHLYKRTDALLVQLNAWRPTAKSFPGRIEELWVFMYEHGYLGKADVALVQSWIETLIHVGYQFPSLVR